MARRGVPPQKLTDIHCGVCGRHRSLHTFVKNGLIGLDGGDRWHDFKTKAQVRAEKREARFQEYLAAERRALGLPERK